jgi:hypothetical protein
MWKEKDGLRLKENENNKYDDVYGLGAITGYIMSGGRRDGFC